MNTPTAPTPDQIAAHLATERFFGAKSAGIDAVEVIASSPGPAGTTWCLTAVDSGGDTDYYQLFVDDTGADRLRDAPVATACGQLIAAGRPTGDGQLHALSDPVVPAGLSGRAISGEQSNTSLIFGDGDTDMVMVKYFRKLAPGPNPEIELLTGLSRRGCAHIAPLRGWMDTTIDGRTTVTAMVQEFARGAEDGWRTAIDRAAADTDFTGYATLLGTATGGVHRDLAAEFPTSTIDGAALAHRLVSRCRSLVGQAPVLAPYARAVEDFYRRLDGETIPVQRIHGDLHLGQTLYRDGEFLLIDFEGEPARPVAQRREPDSALRDVAGMIRSFDYAAHFHEKMTGRHQGPADPQQWFTANRDSFLDGYGPIGSPVVLDAFILDKALYEVVYEANNRPDWVSIPLDAVARLTGEK
ncbi:hypothetical protein ACFSSC_02880 [Corynebacterium mendelii]|uniref:hypothetical protein n=1 Tax=Corynebacterium mendelii TaxID=2765362 RepID=UPI001F5E281F|nr:hypothetical protein [Corynebacterium mendelii]